jgi:hypothetical protein
VVIVAAAVRNTVRDSEQHVRSAAAAMRVQCFASNSDLELDCHDELST